MVAEPRFALNCELCGAFVRMGNPALVMRHATLAECIVALRSQIVDHVVYHPAEDARVREDRERRERGA